MASGPYSSWGADICHWYFLVGNQRISHFLGIWRWQFSLPLGSVGLDLPLRSLGLHPRSQEYSLDLDVCASFYHVSTISSTLICRCKLNWYPQVYMTKVDRVITELHLRLLPISFSVHPLLQGFHYFPDRCLKTWVYNGLILCLVVWLRLWFWLLLRSSVMVHCWEGRANSSNRSKDGARTKETFKYLSRK